ncbi:hypothetical protein Agabi119p4_1260 [Agaricus bisporus var. burnettii]|uniref:Disintegrin and metalloproteinase domain-containing protein B n=1 Tax=Agaricus bisporus var. burnettii TaxID=192524 RepID=A0A8H7KLJ6_AGABI|nr:hypothetical protein Agabi119p4_1260 [Agaricus bisporus var. burnettii]
MIIICNIPVGNPVKEISLGDVAEGPTLTSYCRGRSLLYVFFKYCICAGRLVHMHILVNRECSCPTIETPQESRTSFYSLSRNYIKKSDTPYFSPSSINYYDIGPDGRSVITHSKPLLREAVKAYWGEVVAADHSHARMREDAARISPDPKHPANLGWARIMIHDQGDTDAAVAPEYEGSFSAHGDIYHISTTHNYLRTKHELDNESIEVLDSSLDSNLVIWRQSDMMTPEEQIFVETGVKPEDMVPSHHGCGHDRLEFNTNPVLNPLLRTSRPPFTRWYDNPFGFLRNNASLIPRGDIQSSNGEPSNNFRQFIGQTAGCPTSQKIVLMGVAADCAYTQKLGSQENATRQILTSFNSASTLYKNTFNVSLGILHLSIQNEQCPQTADPNMRWNVGCRDNVDLGQRLSLFSQWRGEQKDDNAGLWHLMSGCPTGTEVGIAWLSTLCTQTASQGPSGFTSGTGVSTSGRLEWQVVAHEIGHNFGANHDCSSDGCVTNCCPVSSTECDARSQFLMSPTADDGEHNFSPCTVGNICSLMRGVDGAQTDTSCLVDPSSDLNLVGLQMCGNGIVEPGEDCDPGQGTESDCCDSQTCKFRPGAVCDPQSSLCCTDQCGFAPSTQVCRPSKDPACDMPEMCTGNSSACPMDQTAPNGNSCGSDGLACASGICTSVSQQCQMVGGSMGLKEACPSPDSSCQIVCKGPDNNNSCTKLSARLIDGSPCGFGGTCIQGKCQAGSPLSTAKAWYVHNLQIAIPVTVVAGVVFLLILWGIFKAVKRCCARRRTRGTNFVAPVRTNIPHQRLPSNDPSVPGYISGPNITRGQSAVNGSGHTQQTSWDYGRPTQWSNWVDDTKYNGPRQ